MALKVGELFTSMSIDRGPFDAALTGIGGSLKGLGGAISSIGGQLKTVGSSLTKSVTAPILALKGAIIKVGTDFDTTLRHIIALTDTTAEEIPKIKAAILELSKQTGKVPQELGEAFYFLASAGFKTDEALDVLKVTAKAAASGLGDTQDLAKIAGAAINAYGKENLTASKAMDILLRGVKDGTAEASDFAGALGDVLGPAAQMGVSMNDLTASLSTLTLKGINVNEAATSMNQIFVSLLKPTKQAEEAMKDMGLSASGIRKEIKEKGLLATLETLRTKFGDNDEAAAAVFGNVRALRGVLGLLGGDASQTAGVFKDLAGAGGDVEQAFKDTEGPGREMDRAMAEVQVALIDLGDTVIPLFVQGLHGLMDVLHQVMDAWDALDPGMQQTIVTVLSVVAAVGPLLLIIGSLAGALGSIISLVGSVGVALAFLVSPIGLIVVGLAALAYVIVTNWSTIQPIVQQVIDAFMGVVNTVTTALQPVIENITTVVIPALIDIFNQIAAVVIPIVTDAIKLLGDAWHWIETEILPPIIQIIGVLTRDVFPALADMVGQVVGFISDHMGLFLSIIKTAFDTFVVVLKFAAQLAGAIIYGVASVISAAINVIADVFEFVAPIIMNVAKVVLHALLVAADALLPVFKTVFEAIANIVQTVAGVISNVISGAIVIFVGAMKAMGDASTAVLKIIRAVWDGITSAIKGAINIVIGIINGFIRAINSIQIHIPEVGVGPVHTPAFDWNGVNLGQIPYLAAGTNWFKGGMAMVGEHGPELAYLPRGTAMTPHSQLGGDGGPGGGGPLIGEQHIYGILPDEVERQTTRAIRRSALDWKLEGHAG